MTQEQIRQSRDTIAEKLGKLELQERRLRAELRNLQATCKHSRRIASRNAIGETEVYCPDCELER